MKPTYIALVLLAQMCAGSALAQTDTTTAEQPEGSGLSASYGSDWSTSLGTAIFTDDGKTVRSSTEIESQWSTLSEADRLMIRRDCMAHMQTQGGEAPATTTGDATQSGTADATGTANSDTGTDPTATTGAIMTMTVTAEQMDQICAATKDL